MVAQGRRLAAAADQSPVNSLRAGAGQRPPLWGQGNDTRGLRFAASYRPQAAAYATSSSLLMRSALRNLTSESLTLKVGLVVRVVTSEFLSAAFSPCLLTPMVASSTRKMS